MASLGLVGWGAIKDLEARPHIAPEVYELSDKKHFAMARKIFHTPRMDIYELLRVANILGDEKQIEG